MDARAKTVSEILQSGQDQYLIPFFQRHYKWRAKQWHRLWEDLQNLLQRGAKERHFMGSLVCTPHSHMPGEVNKYQMIDGQQRITTLTILLAALRDRAEDEGLNPLVEQITENYLVHKWNSGLDRYRVLPRTGDREVLCAVVDGKLGKEHRNSGIASALRFYSRKIDNHLEGDGEPSDRLKQLIVAVTDRLSLVVITIDDENPYEIFWSLNGKGLPLQQSDLIRNYLFMQVPLEQQGEFNRQHWHVLEEMLGETGKKRAARNATRFFRNYVMRNGDYSRKEDTFSDFKWQFKSLKFSPEAGTEDLCKYARYYLQLLYPATVEDAELRDPLLQIEKLDMTTAFPLVMRLMAMEEEGSLSRDYLIECVSQLASFVLRRSICGESTRNYARWFVDAIQELNDAPKENLTKFLLEKQWPDDQAFIKNLVSFQVYRRERKKAELILKLLEGASGHKEPVDLQTLTIEHVMPQTLGTGRSGKLWRDALGSNADTLHKELKDTLGNLTLTGFNSELSNSSYEKKRAEYAKSHLELNNIFANHDNWTAELIRQRSEVLGHEMVSLWPRPEGKPYVPTSQISEEQSKFCLDYWTEFAARLKQANVGLDVPAAASRAWVAFRSPRPGFWYYVEFDRQDDAIYVGIYKNGKGKKDYIDALWNDLPDVTSDQLGMRLNSELEYQEYEKQDELFLAQDAELNAREEWEEQHDWLISALREFKAFLDPYLEDVNLADYYAEDEEDGEDRSGEHYDDQVSTETGEDVEA